MEETIAYIMLLGLGFIILVNIKEAIEKQRNKRVKREELEKKELKKQEQIREQQAFEKYTKSTEYKEVQKRLKQEETRINAYKKKYGEPEKDRSQALEIRSHFEYGVQIATLNILRNLGHYPNEQYELQKSLLRQKDYALSSKQTWEKIDQNCVKIANLTGVKLKTNHEIWQFEENELKKYVEQLRLKESIAGKLIKLSISTIINNNNAQSGVYLIVNNKTLDFYIGESQNMSVRRKTHLGDLVDENHHSKLMQKHFNEYSVKVFDFYVLETNSMENENTRKYAEERWIKDYKPTYNSNYSGSFYNNYSNDNSIGAEKRKSEPAAAANSSSNISEVISAEEWNAMSNRPSLLLKDDNFKTVQVAKRVDTTNSPKSGFYAYSLDADGTVIVRYIHKDVIKDLAKKQGSFNAVDNDFVIDYNKLSMGITKGELHLV